MNKIHILPITSLLIAFTLVGCGGDNDKKPKPAPEPISQSPLSDYKGTWIAEGEALALDIKEDSLFVYNYTRETCSLFEKFDNLSAAEEIITEINSGMDGKQMTFIVNGAVELSRYVLVPQSLPKACENAPDPSVFNPEFLFQHTWHAFNDYYPFFELRDVDWQAQKLRYESQVNSDTTQSELFSILQDMLSPINDGHVGIEVDTTDFADSYSPYIEEGWLVYANAIAQDEGLDANDVYYALMPVYTSEIERYFGQDTFDHYALADQPQILTWGILEGNVGYLQINAMQDYSAEGSAVADIAVVHTQLQRALTTLADTDGLIIDVRFNVGGHDAVSLAIAGYFTDQRYIALTKDNFNMGNPTPRQTFYVEQNTSLTYTKPIKLVTGPNTASAAEIFTMALKERPHVQHIGEATAGALSDILSFRLMDGWQLGLSYQTYYSASDDDVYEFLGVAPDKEIPTTGIAGYDLGIMPAIIYALNEFGTDLSISQQAFDSAVADIMSSTGIPGLGIAWIDDKQLLSSAAMGLADIENELPVTNNTPFNIGSISKTFIAVAAMQQREQGLIDLETSLADVDITFSVESPFFDASTISLQHLATHTSGIKDSDGYGCGYYVLEDRSSLYAPFDEDFANCPSPVETNQSAFLASLLHSNGALYSQENFYDVVPGNQHHYTNIGSALAAEMLTAASGTPFKTWTEENIFAPLGMDNTHWFNEDYDSSDDAPAVRYIFSHGDVVAVPAYSFATWADGALKASPTDLARYLLTIVRNGELDGERILTSESTALMLEQPRDLPTTEGNQGIFWNNDGHMFGHSGGDPGVVADMRYDQYSNLGYVVMFNLSDAIDDLDETTTEQLEDSISQLRHLVYRRGLSLKAALKQ